MEALVIERSIVVKADRERVWRAMMTPEHLAKWFQPVHLADATRRRLLTRLAQGSPKTATQLAREFPLSRQGIMEHLDRRQPIVRRLRRRRDETS